MTKSYIFAPMTKRMILLATHGAQILDVTGPSSVFGAANNVCSDEERYTIEIVSPAGGLIHTSSGVSVDSKSVEETSLDSIDTILVGGHDRQGSESLTADGSAKTWMISAAQNARRYGSVCSGAFPLAAWGLLDQKRAATHWSATEELAEHFSEIRVDPDSIFVVDGKAWTSAGVTTGIDMALAMVEDDFGSEVASEIARQLVVYLRRPGSQSQFSRPLSKQSEAASPYASLIAWIHDHLHEELTVSALASRSGQTSRTFQRHFSDKVGKPPAEFVEDQRLDRAKALISSGVTLKTVAAEVGYLGSAQLTSVFRRRFGVAPSVWKAMHCS